MSAPDLHVLGWANVGDRWRWLGPGSPPMRADGCTGDRPHAVLHIQYGERLTCDDVDAIAEGVIG